MLITFDLRIRQKGDSIMFNLFKKQQPVVEKVEVVKKVEIRTIAEDEYGIITEEIAYNKAAEYYLARKTEAKYAIWFNKTKEKDDYQIVEYNKGFRIELIQNGYKLLLITDRNSINTHEVILDISHAYKLKLEIEKKKELRRQEINEKQEQLRIERFNNYQQILKEITQ